jgi:hypothetical protein
LSHEKIRRLLIKYFESNKNLERFDLPCYPPSLVDLPSVIPYLAPHVEVVPFVEHADIFSGSVAIGWNLCVSGQQIMHLGVTRHNNVADLRNSISSCANSKKLDKLKRTPEEIIEFIMNHLPDVRNFAVNTSPFGLSMIGNDVSSMYRRSY